MPSCSASAGTAALVTALEPVMRRAARRHRFALVFGLWDALGRRAWCDETLLSLIRQALDALKQLAFGWI